jgi:hypothetical protein
MNDRVMETVITATSHRSLARDRAALLVAAGFVLLSYFLFSTASSADFMALWLAGESLAQGTPEFVYPHDTSVFTLLPPDEWLTRLAARGYTGEVFPYIYPPIWAWIIAKLSLVCRYETVIAVISALNPMLLVATVWTARKLAAPTMNAGLYLFVGLGFLYLSGIGSVALSQNQPQILVAFLTVLAIERAENNAPWVAGVALAFAAAIKIYPALYVVFWLARRQFSAVAAFCICGLALAGLSIAMTGWQLHAEFLRVIGVITNTTLLTGFSYNLESTLAQIFYFDGFTFVTGASLGNPDDGVNLWLTQTKPLALSIGLKVALIFTLVWLARLFARTHDQDQRAAIWPFALILISALGPMAWNYHYIASVAFIPMLISRMGLPKGLAAIAFLILASSPYLHSEVTPKSISPVAFMEFGLVFQSWGTLAVLVLGREYFLLRLRPHQANLGIPAKG